jgi:1,2-diacylglycerol-3-alpha-glucose alpha-1,2-glucosyltransferase
MKVALYFESEKLIQTSGIGRAFLHQKMALESAGVEYTTDIEEKFDILHINTVGITSTSVIENARKHGAKIIYHAHSTEEDFRNSFILSNQIAPLLRKHLIHLYSQADFIITPTVYSKKLLTDYGITVEIDDVSNGIDLNRFKYDEEKVVAFKNYFSIEDNQKVVISVGLYFERKGIQDFMEVAKYFPDVKFIWFGYTPMISIPKTVRDLIHDHPRNVILPGYVRGPIIEGAYASADCFFFPSYEETEGIVVLEALASKCPVLIRDIPVYEGWLNHNVSCFKAMSNEGFVQEIKKIINGEQVDTRSEGYKLAEERSISEVGKKLKSIYEKVRGNI